MAADLDAPADPAAIATAGSDEPQRYRNRELSWLDFDARVLALAEDERVPLLERAKFLAISSQNLDEFFQVRVAGLKDQVAAGVGGSSPDGRTAGQQLLDIRDRLDVLVPRLQAAFLDQVALRWPRRASSCRRGPTSTRTTRSSWSRRSRSASSRC